MDPSDKSSANIDFFKDLSADDELRLEEEEDLDQFPTFEHIPDQSSNQSFSNSLHERANVLFSFLSSGSRTEKRDAHSISDGNSLRVAKQYTDRFSVLDTFSLVKSKEIAPKDAGPEATHEIRRHRYSKNNLSMDVAHGQNPRLNLHEKIEMIRDPKKCIKEKRMHIEEVYAMLFDENEMVECNRLFSPVAYDTPDSQFRFCLYRVMFDSRTGWIARIVNLTIIIMTTFSLIISVLESIPSQIHMTRFFDYAEAITTAVFTLEFVVRFFVVRNRCLWMKQSMNICDLIGILPFYCRLIFSKDRIILRSLRLLRITRYRIFNQPMIILLRESFARCANLIRGTFFLMGICCIVFGVLFWAFEEANGYDTFPHVLEATFYAFNTAFGVGYGEYKTHSVAVMCLEIVVSLSGIILVSLVIMTVGREFLLLHNYYRDELDHIKSHFVSTGVIESVNDDFPADITPQDLFNELVKTKDDVLQNIMGRTRSELNYKSEYSEKLKEP